MALSDWLQLSLTDGIGSVLAARLLVVAGSAQEAANADESVLSQVEGIGPARSKKIARALRDAAARVEAELSKAQALGLRLICLDDSDYPVTLRTIPDPPAVLYVKGEIEARDLNALAIVGSRKCSHYGLEQANRFGALLAGAGLTIISGGARGVDTSAHRGAMEHPLGRTIAVLGCGLDQVYPPENADLFEKIAQRGAVITEYALGTPPMRENFPRRNRIVSGLSRGVLVIEADVRSGALITARQAITEHGRPVFALPGRLDNPLSAGPHSLIREGATLVTCLEDILDDLSPLPDLAYRPVTAGSERLFVEAAPMKIAPDHQNFTPRQRAVLDAIGGDDADVELLIQRTRLSPQEVLQDLTLLSLRGAVHRVDGQTYARR